MAEQTKEKIAVVHPNPNFLAAIKATFGILIEGFEFITLEDNTGRTLPADCNRSAPLNTYAFPPSRMLTNHVFGLKFIPKDQDPDGVRNKTQRELFWNAETDPVVIAKMLQTPTEVTLIPESAVTAAQSDMLSAQIKELQAPQKIDEKEFKDPKDRQIAILNAQIEAQADQITAIKKASAL